ncbi:esterase-like activity of phytase family protein [Streptomyces sp. NRRL F-5755]|uniref:esterase-like activity of phytase family protein n=1 Tax=Streptomyces sp. NRRL F-5755 TaxID=1519475 RepID=UPI0006AED635|nr:esterase-like activity of phytase family protein [Streptomyces sp. NRRL F-5755]
MTDNGGYPDPVFNPAESACVIIGVDSYTSLPQLPAVRNNLKALRAALTDRTIGGMPKRNCRVVLNPRTITAALRPVEQAVHTAKDTLIVYYAGHGFLDSKQEGLYLTLPGTEAGKLHSGIPYAWLRSVLGTRTPPRLRIVILDCCYSGSVIKGMSAGTMAGGAMSTAAATQLASSRLGEALFEGMDSMEGVSYLLTSTPWNVEALAPEGEEYTAFTGEFLRVLREGIPGAQATGRVPEAASPEPDEPPDANGPDTHLTLEAIYREVRRALRAKNRPLPQQQSQNSIEKLPFVRNRAARPVPQVPQGGQAATAGAGGPGDGATDRERERELERQREEEEREARKRRTRRRGLVASLCVAAVAVPSFVWWQSRDEEPSSGDCSDDVALIGHSDALDGVEYEAAVPVDGLSGLAMSGPSRAWALADNPPGRIFGLDLGTTGASPPAARAVDMRTLHPTGGGRFDGEGLVLEQGGRTVLVASEAGPSIRRFRVSDGAELGRIELPHNLVRWAGPENLEALGASPDGRYLYAGLEAPLFRDGKARGRGLLRIQRFKGTPGGRYVPDRQYAYQSAAGLRVSELVALGGDRLLVLETNHAEGQGNAVRIFGADLSRAKDVSKVESLQSEPVDAFAKKWEPVDLVTCPRGGSAAAQPQLNPLLENAEGMALGTAPLASGPYKGRLPLFLVSDNNNSPHQITRVYALAVRVGRPAAG